MLERLKRALRAVKLRDTLTQMIPGRCQMGKRRGHCRVHRKWYKTQRKLFLAALRNPLQTLQSSLKALRSTFCAHRLRLCNTACIRNGLRAARAPVRVPGQTRWSSSTSHSFPHTRASTAMRIPHSGDASGATLYERDPGVFQIGPSPWIGVECLIHSE